MLCWADVLNSYPELVPQLATTGSGGRGGGDSLTLLEWGYDAGHPFDAHCRRFRGVCPFYVCPGTSSWSSFGGRTDNALQNLREAGEAAVRHGAAGYLVTDWGDNGHLQPPSVSWLGVVGGAEHSWGAGREQKDDDDDDNEVETGRRRRRRRCSLSACCLAAADLFNPFNRGTPRTRCFRLAMFLPSVIACLLLLPFALLAFVLMVVAGLLLSPCGHCRSGTDEDILGHLSESLSTAAAAAAAATPAAAVVNSSDPTACETQRYANLLDTHVFRDAAGVMGRVATGLGNTYKLPGGPRGAALPNGSVLFWSVMLQRPMTDNHLIAYFCRVTLGWYPQRVIRWGNWWFGRFVANERLGALGVTRQRLRDTLAHIDAHLALLARQRMRRPDADLVVDEFRFVGRLLRFATLMWMARLQVGIHLPMRSLPAGVRRGLAAEVGRLVAEHRRLWAQRSRPGGLGESLSFLTAVADAMRDVGGDGGGGKPHRRLTFHGVMPPSPDKMNA